MACLDWVSTAGDMEDGRCHIAVVVVVAEFCEVLLFYVNWHPAWPYTGHSTALL